MHSNKLELKFKAWRVKAVNREMIFNEFAKYVEADDNYYRFGKHGKIEDMLAWFNIESERFTGPSSVVHCDNLDN